MHVTETDGLVSFEDSTGTVILEVTTLAGAKDTLAHAPGAQVLSGAWKADTLEVERTSARGKMTQRWTLENDGATLVVRMHAETGGDMPARDFKRVYHRDTDS